VSWLGRLLGGASRDEPPAPRGDAVRCAQVQRVLDELAPLLALDGGRLELVAVEGGTVELRWAGACTSCHAQASTLYGALEPRLREELPWLESVRTV